MLGGAALAATPFFNLEDARAALEKFSLLVLDIREYASGIAKGAVLMPMAQLSKRAPANCPSPG